MVPSSSSLRGRCIPVAISAVTVTARLRTELRGRILNQRVLRRLPFNPSSEINTVAVVSLSSSLWALVALDLARQSFLTGIKCNHGIQHGLQFQTVENSWLTFKAFSKYESRAFYDGRTEHITLAACRLRALSLKRRHRRYFYAHWAIAQHNLLS
jgi:hypothetical protein